MKGSTADIAAELRLHSLQATACGDRSIVVAGTALGAVLLWTRRDPAHFTDSLGYPHEQVPVVDFDLWGEVYPRARVLLVASAASGVIIACPVKTTQQNWRRGVARGDRGNRPVWTCPRDQMQSFGWLKKCLLGGV